MSEIEKREDSRDLAVKLDSIRVNSPKDYFL